MPTNEAWLKANVPEETVQASRHAAWVHRNDNTKSGAWRPQAQHRASTKRWLRVTDTQIRQATTLSGWKAFQPDTSDKWQAIKSLIWHHTLL